MRVRYQYTGASKLCILLSTKNYTKKQVKIDFCCYKKGCKLQKMTNIYSEQQPSRQIGRQSG
jgi:hypothetical protein